MEAAGPVDLVDGGIGPLARDLQSFAAGAHVQDPPARRRKLSLRQCGPRVEHRDIGSEIGVCALNDGSGLGRVGIAFGRQDHADHRFVAPSWLGHARQGARGRSVQIGQQIALEPEHQHLAFGIAEPGVELH